MECCPHDGLHGRGDAGARVPAKEGLRCTVLYCLYCICTVLYCTVLQVCALKEENLRLREEHQKNQYLKQIIKQSVPEEVFLTNGMQVTI